MKIDGNWIMLGKWSAPMLCPQPSFYISFWDNLIKLTDLELKLQLREILSALASGDIIVVAKPLTIWCNVDKKWYLKKYAGDNMIWKDV